MNLIFSKRRLKESLSNREHYKIDCNSDSALTVVAVGESASKYHQGFMDIQDKQPLLNAIRDQLIFLIV